MTFKEYLESKKIDPKSFFQADQSTFQEWKNIFDQVSPKSFTQQKLFLINKVRRQYPLVEKVESKEPEKKATPKVKIGRKSLGVKIGKK